jgi:hypothetical protein
MLRLRLLSFQTLEQARQKNLESSDVLSCDTHGNISSRLSDNFPLL